MDRPAPSITTGHNPSSDQSVLVHIDIPARALPRRAGEELPRRATAPDNEGEAARVFAIPVVCGNAAGVLGERDISELGAV